MPLWTNGPVEGAVEVMLRSGRRVRAGSGFNGKILAQVVRVLERLSCWCCRRRCASLWP